MASTEPGLQVSVALMFPFLSRTSPMIVAATSALAFFACRPTQRAAPPAPPPAPRDTQVSLKPVAVLPLFLSAPVWRAEQHSLTVVVSTRDGMGALDSTQKYYRIVLEPSERDSAVSIGVRWRAEGASDTAVVHVLASKWGSFASPLSNACPSTAGYSVTMLRGLVPRYSLRWPVRDTVHYSTCLARVPAPTVAEFEWTAPVSLGDTLWTQVLNIRARVRTDSTRTLPLNVEGVVVGQFEFRFSAVDRYAAPIRGRFVTTLRARGGNVAQDFEQVVLVQAR